MNKKRLPPEAFFIQILKRLLKQDLCMYRQSVHPHKVCPFCLLRHINNLNNPGLTVILKIFLPDHLSKHVQDLKINTLMIPGLNFDSQFSGGWIGMEGDACCSK